MDEQLKKRVQEAVEQSPELVEKFGNPLDDSDPRNWTPTKRVEEGVSEAEQLRLLGLDMEMQGMGMAILTKKFMELAFQLDTLQKWAAQKMADDFIDAAKNDPEKATDMLKKILGDMNPDAVPNPGSWGPLDNSPDANVKFAGSTTGVQPDAMIETPQGWILAKDIPGYVNDPKWKPSPDWVDANCMCPEHRARREGNRPDDGYNGTGLYI